MDRGKSLQRLETCVSHRDARCVAIAELFARLARILQGTSYAEDLNPAQWDALRFFRAPEMADRTAAAFARYQGIQRASANETVRALVRKGLLTRDQNSQHARKMNVVLTKKGEELANRDPLTDIARRISQLTPREIDKLAEALPILYRLLINPSVTNEGIDHGN